MLFDPRQEDAGNPKVPIDEIPNAETEFRFHVRGKRMLIIRIVPATASVPTQAIMTATRRYQRSSRTRIGPPAFQFPDEPEKGFGRFPARQFYQRLDCIAYRGLARFDLFTNPKCFHWSDDSTLGSFPQQVLLPAFREILCLPQRLKITVMKTSVLLFRRF